MSRLTGTPAKRWLARGFESLVQRQSITDQALDYDVVIVGSGYGASMVLRELADRSVGGAPLSICLLERGDEYLEGMFPAELADLPAHIRYVTPTGEAAGGSEKGLFDFRLGGDVSSLVANGLGGGSLINAGVMLRPIDEVFDEGWPPEIDASELRDHFAASETLLGARPLEDLPEKYQALSTLDPVATMAAPLTVSGSDSDRHSACNYCGNCVTGCNFGAKRSLDVQLLASAMEANGGIECYTGATVLGFSQGDRPDRAAGWDVRVNFTEEKLRKRYPEPVRISSRYLVIAAGTFGSTELLLRSASPGLSFSATLGSRFSTNGDMLAIGYGQDKPVNAIARSSGSHDTRCTVGPTITGYVDHRASDGVLIQEMDVPHAIHPLFEQVFSISATLQDLGKSDFSFHRAGAAFEDPFSIDCGRFDATSIYAMMGDDNAAGELFILPGSTNGTIKVRWIDAGQNPLYGRQMELLSRLIKDRGVGGSVIANPLWQPLPGNLDYLGAGRPGPLFTVHPLGGCPMGTSGADGVVDHLGRVFVGDSDEHHRGLVILDGSIVPCSLGTNPALTIAALAHRAIAKLSVIWGFSTGVSKGKYAQRSLPPRPWFDKVSPSPIVPTKIRLRERMVGEVTLLSPSGPVQRTLEITVASDPVEVRDLVASGSKSIRIGENSRIRVFRAGRYDKLLATAVGRDGREALLERHALAVLNVNGTIDVFQRESSWWGSRTVQAGWAWLCNRALRDFWQALTEPGASRGSTGLGRRIVDAAALASRAGERRSLRYRFEISDVVRAEDRSYDFSNVAGRVVTGQKTVTYSRAANPLRQLMRLEVTAFPGLRASSVNVLQLDSRYLARTGAPLIEIVEQQDAPTAIAELLELGGYLVRLLISIHGWTFRLPDRVGGPPQLRMPGPLAGVPTFEQYHVPRHDSALLPCVLSRYERRGAKPVVALHGYSASGTTFAHESLPMSFAESMWRSGYDVWVLDLRTSAGLPTSVENWTFEDVAREDMPLAIQHIAGITGQKVHVVAHCMGAAMFSMAVLGDEEPGYPHRDAMRRCIDRVVLTQVGPGVVFSPANIFRAYLLNYLKNFMNLTRFDFRVDNQGRIFDELIDRVLNVLPYPEEEFALENPAWPPWARTGFVAIRHRMDLLYGRDFSLANVSQGFLKAIDAQFGPLNLETVSQAVQFTRWQNVTDRNGRNRYYQRARLREHWRFPTMSLHGEDNGLTSVETLVRNKRVFRDADVPYQTRVVRGFGHQDIWVSDRSEAEVFSVIKEFLVADVKRPSATGNRPLTAAPPFLGPSFQVDLPTGDLLLKFGRNPNLSDPLYVAVLPVKPRYDGYQADGFDLASDEIRDHATILDAPPPDINGMFEVQLPRTGAAGYLIALVYDESAALFESTFGDPGFSAIDHSRRYEDAEEPSRLRDALVALAERSRSVLDHAVVRVPQAAQVQNCIAFGSCQYPPALIDHNVAYQPWQRLTERLDRNDSEFRPDALLLLGDQVYVDSTAGLFDPARNFDRYTKPHQDLLSNDHVQAVLCRVPSHNMLDDHELANDWEPNRFDPAREEQFDAGESAFRSFQWHSGALRARSPGLWGEVMGKPVPVFMLDTRSDRAERADPATDMMLQRAQFTELSTWLQRLPREIPKVVTCAALPFPRHRPLDEHPEASMTLDGFDGYTATFDELFAFIAENDIQHVVFLSGDEHLPLTARATLAVGGETRCTVYSIHTTPLHAPFPFANAVPNDFVTSEQVSLGGGRALMTIEAQVRKPGCGFTLVRFVPGSPWQLQCLFEGTGEECAFNLD